MSLRTVYRDIATLVAQGAPIEGEAGFGYVLRPGFLLPPLMLGEDEVDAVILGLRLVASRGDAAVERSADDALTKIPRRVAAGDGGCRPVERPAGERRVWPVALRFFADAEVLAAWCELRGGFRHFRLDRVVEAGLLDQRLPKRRRLLLAEWRLAEGIDGPD